MPSARDFLQLSLTEGRRSKPMERHARTVLCSPPHSNETKISRVKNLRLVREKRIA